MPPQTAGSGGGPLTPEQIADAAEAELRQRGQFNEATGRCTICADTPTSHVHPVTKTFRGCGAARKGSLTGQPWVAEGRYELAIPDFPRRAIRSAQERIAFSIVKSLASANKTITSNTVADANPTWSVRDAYRLLQSLQHRGVLNRVDIAGEEQEFIEAGPGEEPQAEPTQETALAPAPPARPVPPVRR